MKRLLGILLAVVGLFIVLLGGFGGTACFIALVPFIMGALLFASAQRDDRRADDDRRHRELMDAMRQSKQ